MVNIWGFLLQTFQLSVISALLLLVKSLLKDKLPPVWHYHIWCVLGLSAVMPAGYMGRYVLRRPTIFLHAVKTLTEQNFSSAYTSAENTVYNTSVIPRITNMPASITDMLFVVYVAGVCLWIIKYIFTYMKLGIIISKSGGDDCIASNVKDVAGKYNLKACPVKTVPGLPSAFVFGVFRPVLVLPGGIDTDEKVILHELLHLKHRDLWQKVVWSFFRRLHWLNPFMLYIFNRINNDMESLCDNRVLQRLTGEERRNYGRILLSMTNEKYPSAFGTTSISNGSRCIKQRIETITRFKKYPRGMGLVSVCITLLFIPTVFAGEKSPGRMEHYNYSASDFKKQILLEDYKLTNCSTVAGALDVYGKSIIHNDERLRLAVNPDNSQQTNYTLPPTKDVHYESGYPRYYTTNLKQTGENSYSAYIMLKFLTKTGETVNTEYNLIPVNITKQNGSWKVYQYRDFKKTVYPGVIDSAISPPKTPDYDGGTQYVYSTGYGDVKLLLDNISFFEGDRNGYRYPHTDFGLIRSHNYVNFVLGEKMSGKKSVGIHITALDSPQENYDTEEFEKAIKNNRLAFTYRGGEKIYNDYWDTETVYNDMGGVLKAGLANTNGNLQQPQAYRIDIFADWELVIHLIIDTDTDEIIA